MALGDIKLYTPAGTANLEARTYVVASGTTASINAGEPVAKALGAVAVTAGANAAPVVGTTFLAGISATTSNETSTAAGSVEVFCADNNQTFLCNATTAASIATQAQYNALVGARVTFGLSGGVYTVNLTDGATNGLIIEPLDVTKAVGKVRFSIRGAAFYNA